jgi:hypothetical protein
MNRKMQGKRLTTMLAAGLLTMAAASSAYAYPASSELAAEWDTTGKAGNEASIQGTGYKCFTAGDLTRGAGLSGSSASNNFGSTGWSGTDAGDYYEFSLSVAAGFKAELDELWIATRSSGTGPGTIGLYSSLDNFSTAIYSITQGVANYVNSVIDLGINLDCGEAITFRLYEIGNTQADGSGDTVNTGTFRAGDYYDGTTDTFYNIGIKGECTSCVPVPAAAWLLGSGLLGLVGLKRKRQ